MAEFDPGPPAPIADHLANVPSYQAHRDLFWYDWGLIFYRGRLDGSANDLHEATFAESDYARIPPGDLPFGVPGWLGDDSVGRQSRPKRRNSVERDPDDMLHTIVWRAPSN